jgi:hypothetical protein
VAIHAEILARTDTIAGMRTSLGILLAFFLAGCGGKEASSSEAKSPQPCRDQVEKGARQAGAAVKAGATTAADGVKQFGKSVGGLVSGGTSEAKQEWKKGGAETKTTAHEGAADVNRESRAQPCD